MSVILKGLWNGYGYLFEDAIDPRSKNWFLVSGPITFWAIIGFYNYFCLVLGPSLMKNREPFQLKNVIKLYNLFQICLSMYIFYEGTILIVKNNFSFYCQAVSNSTDPNTVRLVAAVWVYYMAKLTELLDTVFFVLKKSDRQISFLHLYHHSAMALAGWIAIKYFPGGQAAYIGWINSLIHVFMYTYYFLASFGPRFRKYLWWKRYLTVMQIVQFGLISIQAAVSLFYDCGFPVVLKMLTLAGTITFTWMFSSFYYYNYIKVNKTSLSSPEAPSPTANGELSDKKDS
ncbi:PREDICTED: elongation of very long chain fatty acids protein AAEL008004-like [Papilio xuthus]|uniref:Elongation of very long chain fatty acids protein n=1 Tax=Papilio xuthus TaxID=66420 RepID=A0AAJ6ZRB9_PAPXU|nr:PREDICTED: elongation of very long chain fatty acids protein AAEL008004-like [Papilio xuthus]